MPNSEPPVPATWLTIEDAARAYGVSSRTIRRRVLAGELVGGQVVTSHGRAWRVPPPTTQLPPPDPLTELLARLESSLAPVRAELAQIREAVTALQAERLTAVTEAYEEFGRLRARLAAQEQEIADLRAALATPARRRLPWS